MSCDHFSLYLNKFSLFLTNYHTSPISFISPITYIAHYIRLTLHTSHITYIAHYIHRTLHTSHITYIAHYIQYWPVKSSPGAIGPGMAPMVPDGRGSAPMAPNDPGTAPYGP